MAKEPRNPICRFSSKGLVSASRQEVLFQVQNPLCRFSSKGLVSCSVPKAEESTLEFQFQGIGERITPGSVVPGD